MLVVLGHVGGKKEVGASCARSVEGESDGSAPTILSLV